MSASILRAAIIAAVFIIVGIMILMGKMDKRFTQLNGIDTRWYHRSIIALNGIGKYSIKRLRLVWGSASILFAVSCLFMSLWYMIIVISAIILILVAFILQETWAKKKDSDI